MNNKEIREICVKTDHVFLAPPTSYEAYNDKLRISKQRISYKRIAFSTEKVTKSWDYKTTSKEYSDNFEKLCTHIRMITPAEMMVTDCGGFDIEIIYTDMTSDIFEYSADFHENNLDLVHYIFHVLLFI